MRIILELDAKRVFAAAIDWPGWCRSGSDEPSALATLLAYGERYARVAQLAGLPFHPLANQSEWTVVERLDGDATTGFGAPAGVAQIDYITVDDGELQRLQRILQGCWQLFDISIEMATGRELRSGPRGGGRNVDSMIRHVIEADVAYLGKVGWKAPKADKGDVQQSLAQIRQAILLALAASAHGEVAPYGPRGGARWPARYFARRVAWHVLDHAWEIEDRVI